MCYLEALPTRERSSGVTSNYIGQLSSRAVYNGDTLRAILNSNIVDHDIVSVVELNVVAVVTIEG